MLSLRALNSTTNLKNVRYFTASLYHVRDMKASSSLWSHLLIDKVIS